MKRSLLYLLLVIVLAGYLGTLIARDPGYVLITYDTYSMQTSLWILLGLLGFTVVAFYFLLRLLRWLQRSPGAYRNWRENRQSTRAGQLTSKGMTLLAEGEYERARRFLDGAINSGSDTGASYLAAARAADNLSQPEARETYLRLAEESDSGLARARSIVAAELAIERGDGEAALGALKNIKSNTRVLALKQRAVSLTGDWRAGLELLPDLRKTDATEAELLERRWVMQGFAAETGQDNRVHELFRSLSAAAKQSTGIIVAYVSALQVKDEAESLLRGMIKKTMEPDLLVCYGDLGEATLAARKKHAERWLKKHADNAALQYCLGCIYEAADEPSMARECFTRACEAEFRHEVPGVPGAEERLGRLLAKDGQFERATECFKAALSR